MESPTFAPIVLFVYNRPAHTLKTLKALEANALAADSPLYIYADAARSTGDQPLVEAVAQVIKQPWKFKSITLIQRQENWGLAKNVMDGVTAVLARHKRVIVLEDDLECAPVALAYFNQALTRYQDEEKVMQISGYMYPVAEAEKLPETFFFRVANSWGWATWERAWQHFNADIHALTDDFSEQDIHDFSIDGKENFWKQVQQLKAGKINSWAIRWYASVFKKNGLILYPRDSMTRNIGTDGSGTHSDIERTYDVSLAQTSPQYFPAEITESKAGFEAIKYFYATRKGSWANRGIKYLRKIIHKF